MMAHLEGPEEYSKRQEAIKRRLSSASKSSESKILAHQAKKERRDRPEVQDLAQMARMLMDDGLEMYRAGDMKFEDFVEDLNKALVAVAKKGESSDQK